MGENMSKLCFKKNVIWAGQGMKCPLQQKVMKRNFHSPKPPPVMREPKTPSHCIAKSTNLSNSWHDTSKSLDNDLWDSSISLPTYITQREWEMEEKAWKMRKIISNKRIMSEFFSVNNKKSRLIKDERGEGEREALSTKQKAQTTFTWFTIIQKHFSMLFKFSVERGKKWKRWWNINH